MLIEINENNIDQRLIEQVVKSLEAGNLLIYPTDSVYAIGCDLYNKKALAELARFKGIKLNKANFSIICSSLSHLSDYVKHIDRPAYKVLNRNLPGPFTFILNANNEIPRLFGSNKKEIGIRIPDNKIIQAIVERLGRPLVSSSLHADDEILEYYTDPYEIYERHDTDVDIIIDGGTGKLEASTVIDLTGNEPQMVREGIGILVL
jgi:tRNA threonylcarbamoyl adenosine modification protein (Sua5/YciO/YrdC/YwlC family)